MKYDAVIIGSGLGGLQCGYILSREGYNVCILEKNSQLGGSLQTFRRNNITFDTGMHYIGSMEEGQILYNLFRYFNLTSGLRLKKMDEDGYDVISYQGKEYRFAMSYDRFTDTMLDYFPGEKEALAKYCSKLKEITKSVDVLSGTNSPDRKTGYFDYFSQGIAGYLDSLTSNNTLKNVLLGLSPIYAGEKNKTPLYIPMVIHSSFINSAFRFIEGGSQISGILEKSIKGNGGTIMRNARVTDIIFESGSVKAVRVNDSEIVEGRIFISNIHPVRLLEMAQTAPFRPAYRNRINSLGETCGVFTLYLAMKEKSFDYVNRNFYVFKTDDVWNVRDYTNENWPLGYMMHFTPGSVSQQYAGAVIINTYMRWDDVSCWKETTVEKRGDKYLEFKSMKAEKLLDTVEHDFPGIKSKVLAYYTSTPLTYRDYIGSPTGSIYGMQKDFNDPLGTMVMPRTTISNLFHTGQNINIHGVIGVTICSILTCSEILGSQYLTDKIRNS